MALRYGEYRQSIDVDFLVSELPGYRALRQLVSTPTGLAPLARPGMRLEVLGEIRTDQYGIRARVRVGASVIKFEIVLEARIRFDPPSLQDRICGIHTLTPTDMAAEKLLANADRWADDSVFSRDLIDLAMQGADRSMLSAASLKAEGAYGDAVRTQLHRAIAHLRDRPGRLDQCMAALQMTTVSPARLWQSIRTLGRRLPEKT